MANTNNGSRFTNRGYIEKLDRNADRAYGSLQIRVKTVTPRKAGEHDVLDIAGYGYFRSSSGIEYALGQGILNPETGAASVRATAWDQNASFIQKMNIREGDIVRLYGWFKRHDYTGQDGAARSSIEGTVRQVEIDFRNRNNGEANTPPAQYSQPAPAPQPETPPAQAYTAQPAPAPQDNFFGPDGFGQDNAYDGDAFSLPDELPFR